MVNNIMVNNIMVGAPAGNTLPSRHLLLRHWLQLQMMTTISDQCLLYQFTVNISPPGCLAPIATEELFGLLVLVTQCFKRLDEEESQLSRHSPLRRAERRCNNTTSRGC